MQICTGTLTQGTTAKAQGTTAKAQGTTAKAQGTTAKAQGHHSKSKGRCGAVGCLEAGAKYRSQAYAVTHTKKNPTLAVIEHCTVFCLILVLIAIGDIVCDEQTNSAQRKKNNQEYNSS